MPVNGRGLEKFLEVWWSSEIPQPVWVVPCLRNTTCTGYEDSVDHHSEH